MSRVLAYVVRPETSVKLTRCDPARTTSVSRKAQAHEETALHTSRLLELQEVLYAEVQCALLVVVQFEQARRFAESKSAPRKRWKLSERACRASALGRVRRGVRGRADPLQPLVGSLAHRAVGTQVVSRLVRLKGARPHAGVHDAGAGEVRRQTTVC